MNFPSTRFLKGTNIRINHFIHCLSYEATKPTIEENGARAIIRGHEKKQHPVYRGLLLFVYVPCLILILID